MIIIGERINSTRARIKEAIVKKDTAFLLAEASSQISCGAEYLDINCATTMDREIEDLIWLISEIQNKFGCKICIDSPHPKAVKAALKVHKGKAFINSITAEKHKLDELLPAIRDTKSCVIALAMDEKGMPENTKERIAVARKIIAAAQKTGVNRESVYIDPLVKPVSTEPKQAAYFLEAVKILKSEGIKTTGGLSNVSFGLPKRHLINAVFLKLAISCGIDAVIIDPTAPLIEDALAQKLSLQEGFALAEELLLGRDEYSMNYIKAFRQGRLNI